MNKYVKKVKTIIVNSAPISERYWSKGDEAIIYNGEIRLNGGWFPFDDRYDVEYIEPKWTVTIK